MVRCSSFRSDKASNAAWRFFSDLACALILHCSVRVRFVVVDAPIPEALLFDGGDHFLSVPQFLFMLLPCSRLGWISAQRFHGDEQVRGFVLPDRQMPFARTQFWTGGPMRRVGTAIRHGQMNTISKALRERGNIPLPYFVFPPSPSPTALISRSRHLLSHPPCYVPLFLSH